MRATLPLTFVADWRLFAIYLQQAGPFKFCLFHAELFERAFPVWSEQTENQLISGQFFLLDRVLNYLI